MPSLIEKHGKTYQWIITPFGTRLALYNPPIELTFTSASSSTSATYTATVEGSEGLTVELFLGGVFQGNMTESSSGIYELDVTLDSLSNALVVKVGGIEYASLDVLSYAYWQENGSLVFMGGVPESSWATSAYLSGGSTGRTFISPSGGAHAKTPLRSVHVNSISTSPQAGAKVKQIRWTGSQWNVIAEQSFTIGTTAQIVTLTTPFEMEIGDLLGLYLPNSSSRVYASDYYTIANGAQNTLYDSGDKTGNGIAFASSIGTELEMEALGDRASFGLIGDSIFGGSTNWTTPYDTYTTARTVIPSGNQIYDLGYQIEQIINDLRWINYARGSQTWAYAASTAFPRLVAADVHTALLMFGVNDVSQARTWANIEADLDTIKTAWDASNVERLYICEILPWTAGNDTQAATIRTFNANLATWCAANGATLIETHDAFGQTRVSTGELDDLKTAYNSDGVHLTQAGMEALAAIIATYL